MKITHLLIHNIGLIADEKIAIEKPLIIFYGEICAGKTTILNCVRWVCGGEFPTDILRHGAKEGHIELQFDHGHLRREFYLAKDGKTVKARPIEFVRDGRPVAKPVAEIEKLLNPFALDQDYLVRKNEADRNRFFIELFGVDTSKLDNDLYTLEREATELRAELKGFGEIDLTKQERADMAKLKEWRQTIVDAANKSRTDLEAQLEQINADHQRKQQGHDNEVFDLRSLRQSRTTAQNVIASANEEIRLLQIKIGKLQETVKSQQGWLESNPDKPDPTPPTPPDTTELKGKIHALHTPDTAEVDLKISNAAAQNVRADTYERNLERDGQRQQKQADLATREAAIKAKREERIGLLRTINESCKIEGLKFTETGDFSFEDTSAAMLSTSQIIRLSKKISDLFPPGLGIELLDRGESLGRSIFDYVNHANTNQTTVLATVVGERPAAVPADVGVFVVKDGVVIKDAQ
jgi:hypothetical protein